MIERLDAFMARGNAAYYARANPYADFTTAPEISQVFGELIGLWAAMVWQSMGAPPRVVLAEAGPGRGTLMADALRAVRSALPGFAEAAELHLIETSPGLRAEQARRLQATWHDAVTDLPDGPCILIANEFLDALPIRQFVRRDGWKERFVADGRFVERDTTVALPEAPAGTVLERCEPALAIARHLAARFAGAPGAALFIDYGPAESAEGDSLQALRHGQTADPLAACGEADLTAHVDFQAFAAAAAGCAVHGPVTQGRFLTGLGLYQRTVRLAQGQPPAQAAQLMAAARRLAEPQWMGHLFKAVALCHADLPPPPGFSP